MLLSIGGRVATFPQVITSRLFLLVLVGRKHGVN